MQQNMTYQYWYLYSYVISSSILTLELHLAISELWFGQEWEGILLELLCSSSIV